MSRWFRFYDDAINDPKILKLSDKTHRIWVGMLCLASKNNGVLPPFEDIALMLRMKPEKLQPELEKLISVGLLDHSDIGISPHNWNKRQYKSDVSTDRVKRFRNGERNVSETPPDTDTEADNRKKDTSGGKYFFESGAIRLTQPDFKKWEEGFSHLDLRAELIGLSKWAGEQSNWFHAVSGALAKRNREIGLRKSSPPQTKPLSPFGTEYPDGII